MTIVSFTLSLISIIESFEEIRVNKAALENCELLTAGQEVRLSKFRDQGEIR